MNGESIPNYVQVPENANVPFAIHVGDFLKGRASGNTGRCNPDSFESRLQLFNSNRFVIPFLLYAWETSVELNTDFLMS